MAQRRGRAFHTQEKEQQFSLFGFDADPQVKEEKSVVMPSGRQNNFIVYVDESGDYGMQTVDPNYPLLFWCSASSTKEITAKACPCFREVQVQQR